MRSPEEKPILDNVKNSIEKIKSFFNISNQQYQITDIHIEDIDITRTTLTLEMVLIAFTIECEFFDYEFSEIILTLKEVDKLIDNVLKRVSFDSKGVIKKPNEDNLTCGGVLVNSINSTRDTADGKVTIVCDVMFSS